MSTSRRDFLKKGSLVALAAGVPSGLAVKALGNPVVPPSPVAFGLTKASFEAQLNTRFQINTDTAKIGVRLVDVSDLPRRGATGPAKEAFSLLFRGDQSTAFKQNTYLIEHDQLGLFPFLLVPVKTKDKHAQYYEAIINRLYP
jgi:Domain of unknown function (DUF6916)